jgi:hypothetical protein
MMKAQFTDADVAEAVKGLGATVLKPRKAKKPQCRVKSSKGFVKGSGGIAAGYPRKTFV